MRPEKAFGSNPAKEKGFKKNRLVRDCRSVVWIAVDLEGSSFRRSSSGCHPQDPSVV